LSSGQSSSTGKFRVFSTWSDASDLANGLNYRSSNGLPWADEIAVSFAYPVELVDILNTHLKFAGWAQSTGVDYTDLYMNETG
jgi:LruC domain-containing protein